MSSISAVARCQGRRIPRARATTVDIAEPSGLFVSLRPTTQRNAVFIFGGRHVCQSKNVLLINSQRGKIDDMSK